MHAAPFVPKDDDQVLERLRPAAFPSEDQSLRELRAKLKAQPEDLKAATKLARHCIEQSRADGDPRHLGHAQAVLAPWWENPKPPNEILVLRATLRQSQHDFTGALKDLDLAVAINPADAQAWLTRAAVLTVVGRYDEARRSCLPLVRFAPQLVAITAAANIAVLTGEGQHACQVLENALQQNPSSQRAEQLWALTILAETSARLGNTENAEAYFHRALGLGEHDVYLLGAYADFLLDQGRAQEVQTLLAKETRVDSLLIRLALAESSANSETTSFRAHMDALRARFEASRLRGEVVHRREESRFVLHLLHQPEAALKLAAANWQVQREPADARVLLEAALAAHHSEAALPVLEFMKANRLRDVHLDKLAAQCGALAAHE